MTKDEIQAVFDRVMKWPPERQQEAAKLLLVLEAHEGEFYHPTDDEWAAVQEGLEQARRGEFASEEEMEALWKRFGA